MMKSLIFRKRKISHLFSLKLLSITIAILALFGTIHISINLNSIENNLSPKLGGTEDLIFSEISEINDDSLGSSQGNGDGKADIGETIEMQIYLENTGTTDL